MAYYVKKDPKKNEQKKPQEAPREKKFFFQVLGCAIVMIIVAIIGVVKSMT